MHNKLKVIVKNKVMRMQKTKFVYYKEGNYYVGYLEEYPEYMTQGKTLEELSSEEIPNVRHVGELIVK